MTNKNNECFSLFIVWAFPVYNFCEAEISSPQLQKSTWNVSFPFIYKPQYIYIYNIIIKLQIGPLSWLVM